MTYKKRFDGRKFDEIRPMTAKAGVIKKADGSGYFSTGKTSAYAAVYGPRELHPKFMQDPTKGILRVNYSMMPFSGVGGRVRPGPNRRAKELCLVIQKAIEPVLNLKDFPNSVVDVFIELPETDAGSRCASINAAVIALADAGIIMKDLVSAVAVGRVDDKIVVDLDYKEEHYNEFREDKDAEPGANADIPVAMIPTTGEVTLLQLDGDFDPKDMPEALKLAKKGCEDVKEILKNALKNKFLVGEDNE